MTRKKKSKKKYYKKKTSEAIQRRKHGSARGIASYEQYMIQQSNTENTELKNKLKS